jgi:hypothetical protein
MARPAETVEVDWTAVIAGALAFLCVREAQMDGDSLVDQAKFLQRFGIPRPDAAEILGTTQKSLAEMERQQRGRKSKSSAKKPSARKTTGTKTATGRTRRG